MIDRDIPLYRKTFELHNFTVKDSRATFKGVQGKQTRFIVSHQQLVGGDYSLFTVSVTVTIIPSTMYSSKLLNIM